MTSPDDAVTSPDQDVDTSDNAAEETKYGNSDPHPDGAGRDEPLTSM